MADTITFIHRFDSELSYQEYEQCQFPFKVIHKVDHYGQILQDTFAWIDVTSELTGAKFKVRACSTNGSTRERIAGYEVEINVPATLIGRNHVLVNGVPRAAEAALALLKYYAARNGCSQFGLSQFQLGNVCLKSVTGTFLFECKSAEEALCRLRELKNHADGVLNHAISLPSREKSGKPTCFLAGADERFTLYIKQREFHIAAYIKQPNVPDAFATFPNAEIKKMLTELAQRIVRVEVTAHGKWLRDQGLDQPEAWRNNPAAYGQLFQLARKALRLDENLRVRLPSQDQMDKLPDTLRTVLQFHLNGENARKHAEVMDGDVTQAAQNKRFSAFKRQVLEKLGIDLSIPWSIQRSQLSPHLKDWFVHPGEYEPSDELAAHVFSRESTHEALKMLEAMIFEAISSNSPRRKATQ